MRRMKIVWNGNRASSFYSVCKIVLEVSIPEFKNGPWANREFGEKEVSALLTNLFGGMFPPSSEFRIEE